MASCYNKTMDIEIIPFQEKYRDNMFLCYLLAKEALRKKESPRIREDLFDIQKNYFDKAICFGLP